MGPVDFIRFLPDLVKLGSEIVKLYGSDKAAVQKDIRDRRTEIQKAREARDAELQKKHGGVNG